MRLVENATLLGGEGNRCLLVSYRIDHKGGEELLHYEVQTEWYRGSRPRDIEFEAMEKYE